MNTYQSHCGPNAFSPQAPAHLCANAVPEPGIFWLLAAAGVVAWIVGRKRK